jgi:hypothetical protein
MPKIELLPITYNGQATFTLPPAGNYNLDVLDVRTYNLMQIATKTRGQVGHAGADTLVRVFICEFDGSKKESSSSFIVNNLPVQAQVDKYFYFIPRKQIQGNQYATDILSTSRGLQVNVINTSTSYSVDITMVAHAIPLL